MASPKSKRSPPERRVDDYVLYHLQDAGLSPVRDDQLQLVQGFMGFSSSLGYTDLAGPFEIGFDFSFNSATYKQIMVAKAGWMLLIDPTVNPSSVTIDDVGLTTGFDTNTFLSSSFPSGSHIVIAPWATRVRPISNSHPYQTSTLGTRVLNGNEPAPAALLYDEVEHGIRHGAVGLTDGRTSVVRWNGYSTCNSSLQVHRLKFDVVLSENGRIDFCYGPKQRPEKLFYEDTTTIVDENVAVLLITSNEGVRDFSLALGHAPERTTYKYGGFKPNGTFIENGASYANTLRYDLRWPGGSSGGRLSFRPPTNRRVVLRGDVQLRAGEPTFPPTARGIATSANDARWNDQDAVLYTTSTINFPTTLARFDGSKTTRTADRQDLFVHDFETTTLPRSRIASDEWVGRSSRASSAYVESSPQDRSAASNFYLSSSDASLYVGLLSPSLMSKQRIDLSFPVNFTTRMLENTGSIYYYSPDHKRWLLPNGITTTSTGSVTSSTLVKSVNYTFPEISPNPASGSTSFVGFTPAGAFAASASYAPATVGQSPRQWWEPGQPAITGDTFTQPLLSSMLGVNYDKSITVDKLFDAGPTMTFTLPIDQEFALEKVEVRAPFAASANWFRDVTRSALNGATNFGGPTLTFALFHEQLSSEAAFRNLILTGTITNVSDSVGYVSASMNSENIANFATIGLPAHGATPGFIVAGVGPHTGTVELRCEAAVSNGVTVLIEVDLASTSGTLPYLSSSTGVGLLGSAHVRSPEYVSPLGRSKSGFNFDARSPYGKTAVGARFALNNPFNKQLIDPSNVLSSGSSPSSVTMSSFVQQKSNVRSPYIVKRNDRLVLAMTKAAPVDKGATHDVSLASGTLQLSFYGCTLRSGVEREASSQQQLLSNAIHQIVGDEPIIDQTDGAYSTFFSGTHTDGYMLGGLVRTGGLNLTTGSRVQLFSRTNARATALYSSSFSTNLTLLPSFEFVFPFSGTYDIGLLNNSLAEIIQPTFVKAGTQRVLPLADSSERFYDTLIPSISECVRRTGAEIVAVAGNAYNRLAFIEGSSTNAPFADGEWIRSFPFEPKYSTVRRLASLDNSFLAERTFAGSVVGMVTIPPFVSSDVMVSYYNADFAQIDLRDTIFTSGSVLFPFGNSISRTDRRSLVKFVYGFGRSAQLFVSGTGVGQNAGLGTMDFWYRTRPNFNLTLAVSPKPEGWKYGLRSGFPDFSTAYWRRDRFGQFRDMLEQRPMAKFFVNDASMPSPVNVRYLDSQGRLTQPESTWSWNLSAECTSSLPYFDGEARNRGEINISALNQSIVTLNSTQFGNPTI